MAGEWFRAGWRCVVTEEQVVHVRPIGDLVPHELTDACVCGPTLELTIHDDGPDGPRLHTPRDRWTRLTMRVCAEPGCGELTTTRRCQAHTRQADRKRGTTKERGYTGEYERERDRLAERMRAGKVFSCWRCSGLITSLDELSLGHCDDDRTILHGAEHRQKCNLSNTRGGCPHSSHRGLSHL